MKLNLRDALQHIISSGGSPGSPEWESQHLSLSDVMSTMDNIASASLTQMTQNRGDLRLAFQTLDSIEPENEFQVAMAQYALASLQLLENLGGLSGRIYPDTPSTVIPELGVSSILADESKVNLLQSLSEYTDSRLTMAAYTSFPSTPFSDSLMRSLSQTPHNSPSVNSERLSISRASMSSRHLGHRVNIPDSSTLNTPVTHDTESQNLQTSHTYYEPMSEMGTISPSTVITMKQDEPPIVGNKTCLIDHNGEVGDPLESHDQNTALCKALALQALTDLTVTPESAAKKSFPNVRPLGGSSSFRHPKRTVIPGVLRSHSLNGDPLYMTYKVSRSRPVSHASPIVQVLPPKLPTPSSIPKNPLPPRKPARQFSTKSSRRSCTTMDSVKALQLQQGSSAGNSGSIRTRLLSPHGSSSNGSSPTKQFSFIDKTKSLINRARFGSRNNKKKESTKGSFKIDPTTDKSKTL